MQRLSALKRFFAPQVPEAGLLTLACRPQSLPPESIQSQFPVFADPSQQRRPQRGAKPARARMKPVPEAAVGAVRETLREHGEPVSAGGMTFVQARTANEVLKAQERRVRLQRMKGELVDRARAVAQVFKLARDERDAWVNWPARVAAMMAAELEVDTHKLHTALERHVREHLGELAEVRPSLR